MKVRMKRQTSIRSISVLALALLILFVPCANAVDIPDGNLEAAIRDELGIFPPDPITETDLAGLMLLDFHQRNITNLTGLEYCVNLWYLNLMGNNISDISALSGLSNLRFLKLVRNNISDISALSGLTNLEELMLSYNDIDDFSILSGLSNLRFLYLAGNDIDDFSILSGLSNLETLELSNNNISDISAVSGLSNLEHLSFNNNNISDISALSGLTNLDILELSYNDIDDFSILSGLSNLRNLKLGGNDISDISAVSGLTNLDILYLFRNDISDISPLSGLANLRILYLFHNDISDIQPLVDNPGLVAWDYVWIVSNPLSYEAINTDIPILLNRGVEVVFDDRTPTTLVKVSGDGQTGLPGSQLPDPFVVRVLDQNGDPFEGVPVTFSVIEGGGSLNIENTTTEADGFAGAALTLGPSPGTNRVSVTAAEIATPVIFDAIGASPPLIANWSGPEPVDVFMGNRYKINVSIFADGVWPGGTIRLRLLETSYYPDDKWNSGNDELLNDVGDWAVYNLPVFGGAPILFDEDYKIGTEYVELYVPAGGGTLPLANLYFEGSHKWSWIRPWSMSRIVEWISTTAFDQVLPGSSFQSLDAYSRTINESVLRLPYSYSGSCDDVLDNDFGVVRVYVPEWKKFALAESVGFVITGSPFTTLALGIIKYGGGEIQLSNPVVIKAFASQALLIGCSQLWYILAADPPDMDYETLAVPVPISTLAASMAPRATELEATIRALKKSLEKWEGARLSSAVEWQAIQLSAARYYAQSARDILHELATFWENEVFSFPAPTPEQIQLARDWVEENGLPAIETDILHSLGFTSDEIEELAQMIISIDDTYFEQTYKLPGLLEMCAEASQEFESVLPDAPQNVTETTVYLGPSVLNMKSRGKWITSYIEPPEGHDVSEIDVSSLKLQNAPNAEIHPSEVGDYDNDGIPDLMIKFDRQELIDVLGPGEHIIYLTGQLSDGTPLVGIDTIRVID